VEPPLTQRRTLGLLSVLPLYLAIATAAGFVDFRVRPGITFEHAYRMYVPAVLNGTEAPPAKYRILAPYVYAAIVRVAGVDVTAMPAGDESVCGTVDGRSQPHCVSLRRARDGWFAFRWLCLVAALLSGHLLFRTWFATGPVVAGNAISMVLLWLTFSGGYGHPDHLLELVLFTLACACVARQWDAPFVAVLALGALNRETSAFLIPLFLFARAFDRRHLAWSVGAGAAWLGVMLVLRWQLGWVPYNPLNLAQNVENMTTWADRDLYYRLFGWFFLIMVVPVLFVIGRTWAQQPRYARVAAGIVTPAILVTGFVFSSVWESRIFTPVIPLLVPGLLFALFPERPDA
jgi:hypothetical protein